MVFNPLSRKRERAGVRVLGWRKSLFLRLPLPSPQPSPQRGEGAKSSFKQSWLHFSVRSVSSVANFFTLNASSFDLESIRIGFRV